VHATNSMDDKIKVLLVDDHQIVREGLRALLTNASDMEVVGEASDGRDAIDLAGKLHPDVVVMDLSLKGLHGEGAIRELRRRNSDARILVLSMYGSPDYVRPAVRAGATGYLVKGSGISEFVDAIRAVSSGQPFYSPEVRQAAEQARTEPAPAGERSPLDELTAREREVLQLVALGQTNREIAETLGLSAKTVDGHRTRIMAKLDLHDAASLTRFAIRHGLVSPDQG
jgi:two-component system, NarL family, response regulator NreC